MTKKRQWLGREGEDRATRFLEARGYRIVARNVRAGGVELDVIATKGPRLVFIEVKTRRASSDAGFGSHGRAAEAVDPRKQARLRRGGIAWRGEHPQIAQRHFRHGWDVVTCIYDASPSADATWTFRHWQNAF